MNPKPGGMLSHYHLVELIGEGGMGVVFRALDTRLDRQVAIKVLRPELTADAARRRRFLKEARTAAAVNHPNIATIHDVGEADGIIFIVMELVEGRMLSAVIAAEPMPADQALHIAEQMAEGVARAHHSRIIHRDLKPDNVIVGPDRRAKILDFGLAEILEEAEPPAVLGREGEEAVTRDRSFAGRLLGTVGYMSPEQARGDRLDPRSDVFSFGVILYEMLTGHAPFTAASVPATLAKILETEPEPLASLRPDLRPDLVEIVARCLQKQRAERFEDGAALARALVEVRSTVWAPRPSEAPAGAPTTIAVLPFTVRGSQELAYLGAGMVDLLSTKLDGAGEIRSVDPHVILACVEPGGEGTSDLDAASAVARRFGAGLFILGNVLEIGGQIHLDASLYEAERDRLTLQTKASARGEAANIFEMVDHLTAELLAGRPGGPGYRLARIAAMATGSFTALKSYLEGETHMRALRRAPAADAYRSAVTADPTFALAWYRLSVASLWSGQSHPAVEASHRAVAQSHRLSERDRGLLKAFEASLRGANDEAERLYRAIVGEYPDDVEAWYQLAELLFHCGPQRGRPIAESREAWRRLLFLDPRHVNGLVHLAVIASSVGDLEELEATTDRILQLSPEGDAVSWVHAFRAFSRDDPSSQAEAMAELRQKSDYTVAFAAQFLGAYLGHAAGAHALAGLLTETVRSPEVRAAGHVLRAHLHLTRGQWRGARAELQRAEMLHATPAGEFLALLSAFPFLETTPADLTREATVGLSKR